MTLDPLETRSSSDREQALFQKLPSQIAWAKSSTAYFGELFKEISPNNITSREMLAKIPVTRKSDLSSQQKNHPPFGGLNATRVTNLKRIFQSPGPIYEPQGNELDGFRMARALRAAGFVQGDLVHNTFSYHFTPGAWMMEGGAHALGCCVFPAGVGQTELQAITIAQLQPTAYTGTPSFLKIILEKSDELKLQSSSIQKALVSGEALTPSMRAWFINRGITVVSAYATADVGLIAYETPELVSGMIVDEEIILEIVEPNGMTPLPIGEIGEVVITVFNQDYPLIRFGTGDLSAIDRNSMHQAAPCGRTNLRIKGWLGRADQTTKIKGMFVHPSQVGEIMKKHPEIQRARIIVSGNIGNEEMTLHCVLQNSLDDDLQKLNARIVDSVREVTKLRATVVFRDDHLIPQDGKVIEDARTYA